MEKVRALNYDLIRSVVENYLTSSEINAILIRKELLLKEIDDMINEKGEGEVLY